MSLLSAKTSVDLFCEMLDVKPIVCSLPTLRTNSNRYKHQTCFPSSSLTFSHYDGNLCLLENQHHSVTNSRQTKYPDVPKSSGISDRKKSIYTVNDQRKSIEFIFKENPKKFIPTKLTTNKEVPGFTNRHVGSQTDYRDESTQTDPFSPPYTISSGEHPEVFALSNFTYGKGLPATSLEISFIERLRARREWEQDHTIDMTRTKIVIEREIREWQIREKEMKILQDTQQKLFTKNLQTYINTDEEVTQSIIDLFIYREEKQLKFQHERLELETSRNIRRMKRMYRLREAQINAVTSYNHLGVIGIVQCGNGCFSSLKPPWRTRPDDIITTFANITSTTYIPCSHFDQLIDRRIQQSRINIFKLEDLLPKHALIPTVDRAIISADVHRKKGYRRLRDLEKAFQLIQEEKKKQSSIPENKPLRFVEKIEIIDHTNQSQTIPIQTEAHDQLRRRTAIINFQNYLRAITVQSKISNVRQIREHLLEELRSGSKHDRVSSMDTFRNQVVTPQGQIYDYLEGATIGDMLDFLSKERFRLQCEQTIHLFILLADRYRYARETTETGHRIRSIERQKLEDRLFLEMFSINSTCDIETYLQDLILQSISHTADEQARLEIQQITETLINRTDQINTTSSNQLHDIERIVSELVHEFLFPTVQKILTQSRYQKLDLTRKLSFINN